MLIHKPYCPLCKEAMRYLPEILANRCEKILEGKKCNVKIQIAKGTIFFGIKIYSFKSFV